VPARLGIKGFLSPFVMGDSPFACTHTHDYRSKGVAGSGRVCQS
jgi:hypothetical protein